LGYIGKSVILGVPSGMGIVRENTSFTFLMPIILSNYKLTKDTLIKFSLGGYL
jgi:hypothetical protein